MKEGATVKKLSVEEVARRRTLLFGVLAVFLGASFFETVLVSPNFPWTY